MLFVVLELVIDEAVHWRYITILNGECKCNLTKVWQLHVGFRHQRICLELVFLIQFHGGNSFKLLHERPYPFDKRDSNLVKGLVKVSKGIIEVYVCAEWVCVSNIEQGNVSDRWQVDEESTGHIVRIAFCLLIVRKIRSAYCNHDNSILVRLHQLWVNQRVKQSIFFNY